MLNSLLINHSMKEFVHFKKLTNSNICALESQVNKDMEKKKDFDDTLEDIFECWEWS